MNYDILNIFPTTVYAGVMENHETHKKSFYKIYHKFDYEETKYDNTVSENVGNPLIHLEDSVEDLFLEIISHAKNYLHNVLNLKDIFNLTITKTWLSRARSSKNEIPWHVHTPSHISFCYYLNVPPNSHKIQFLNRNFTNNLFPGIFKDDDLDSRMMIKGFNKENCEVAYIIPEEGLLLFFPSNLTHSTKSVTDDFNGERLAISGDITLTLKEEYLSYSMGYIDKKYWKTYY